MELLKNLRPIIVAGTILAFIVLAASVVVIRFGRAYQWGIFGVNVEPSAAELTLREKKKLRKITIRKGSDAGCIEVTPDGAVRVYSTCGEELESAHRPLNPKNVLKLFKLLSERDLSKIPVTSEGTLYEITIVTDEGTQVFVIVVNDDSPDALQEVVDTITDIEEEVPEPTVTPEIISSTPTSPPAGTGSPVPSGTPTPTGPAVDVGFLCDFFESTGPKPFNISNFVCSTGPTPFPQ